MIKKILTPFLKVAFNFGILMGLYTVVRILFILGNLDAFPGLTFAESVHYCLCGMRFDLSVIAECSILYTFLALIPYAPKKVGLYSKITKWSYIIPNFAALVFNIMDITYFAFDGRRTTCTFFSEFSHDTNIGKIVIEGIVSFWYLYIMGAIVMFCMYKFYLNTVRKSRQHRTIRIADCAIMLLILTPYVMAIRGGLEKRHLTIQTANQYVDNPLEASIVLNTPFCLLHTFGGVEFEKPEYFTDEKQMKKLYNSEHSPVAGAKFQPKNVCVLIMESFSASYSAYLKREQGSEDTTGYMPFLDSLMRESYVCRWSFANGRKSVEAMPSSLSSIPSLVEPFFLTPYYTDELSGIAGELVRYKGYSSAFFHGAPAGSMGFEAFSRKTGFEGQYNMETYGDKSDFDGTWAIWDGPFLDYYRRTMDQMQQPFVTSIFTASSHHPFKVPKEYEGKFDKGVIPMHQCIGYTDEMLRQFFENAKNSDWYNNTLFVITGDHTSLTKQKDYLTNYGIFEIPILFFDPSGELPRGIHEGIAQQADIMPTVMHFLGYDRKFIAFGSDLLDPEAEHFAVNYLNNCYQFFYEDYCLQFDGERIIGLYDFKRDRLQENDLQGTMPELQDKMLNMLKSIIQQYMQRMIDNQLVVE